MKSSMLLIIILSVQLFLSCNKIDPVSDESRGDNAVLDMADAGIIWETSIIAVSSSNTRNCGFDVPDGYFWSGIMFFCDASLQRYSIRYNIDYFITDKRVEWTSTADTVEYKTYFIKK